MCLISIPRSLELRKKYWIKFKNSSGILFLQKVIRYPELGENEAPLKTHLYFLFRNCFLTQKTLNSSSRSKESHTSFGNFFKKYSKVSVTNFNTKGLVVARKLATRKKKVTCINEFKNNNKWSHKIIQKITHIFQSVYIT